MSTSPNAGVLGHLFSEKKTYFIPIQEDQTIFNEKTKIPFKPMVRMIGTTPATEENATSTPGAQDGNMDCKKIKIGSPLYLPVNIQNQK